MQLPGGLKVGEIVYALFKSDKDIPYSAQGKVLGPDPSGRAKYVSVEFFTNKAWNVKVAINKITNKVENVKLPDGFKINDAVYYLVKDDADIPFGTKGHVLGPTKKGLANMVRCNFRMKTRALSLNVKTQHLSRNAPTRPQANEEDPRAANEEDAAVPKEILENQPGAAKSKSHKIRRNAGVRKSQPSKTSLPVGYSIGDELYIISTECSTPYGTKVKVEGALPSGTALRVSLPDSDKIIEHKLKELTKNESDIVTLPDNLKPGDTIYYLSETDPDIPCCSQGVIRGPDAKGRKGWVRCMFQVEENAWMCNIQPRLFTTQETFKSKDGAICKAGSSVYALFTDHDIPFGSTGQFLSFVEGEDKIRVAFKTTQMWHVNIPKNSVSMSYAPVARKKRCNCGNNLQSEGIHRDGQVRGKSNGVLYSIMAVFNNCPRCLGHLLENRNRLARVRYQNMNLMQFAACKNAGNCIRLLKDVIDCNEISSNNTPVYLACETNSADALRALAEIGADLNLYTGQVTPVGRAARNGSVNCLRVLHELGSDVINGGGKFSSLHQAVCGRYPDYMDSVKYLLSIKASINAGFSRDEEDSDSGDTIGIKTPLYILAQIGGTKEQIRSLVEMKADIKDTGPLIPASYLNNCETVSALLENKADPNGLFEEHPGRFVSPLFYGARYPNIVELLLKKHADVNNVVSERQTPFLRAVGNPKTNEQGNLKCVQLMIAAEGNVNCQAQGYGVTPLGLAMDFVSSAEDSSIPKNQIKICNALIWAGADIDFAIRRAERIFLKKPKLKYLRHRLQLKKIQANPTNENLGTLKSIVKVGLPTKEKDCYCLFMKNKIFSIDAENLDYVCQYFQRAPHWALYVALTGKAPSAHNRSSEGVFGKHSVVGFSVKGGKVNISCTVFHAEGGHHGEFINEETDYPGRDAMLKLWNKVKLSSDVYHVMFEEAMEEMSKFYLRSDADAVKDKVRKKREPKPMPLEQYVEEDLEDSDATEDCNNVCVCSYELEKNKIGPHQVQQINDVGREGVSWGESAAMYGCLKCMRYLIENKADLKYTNEHGRSLLHLAALSGNIPLIRELGKVIDPNYPKDVQTSSLYHLCVRGFTDAVQAYLELGADPNEDEALHKAVISGDKKLVQVLLDGNADPNLVEEKNGQSTLSAACIFHGNDKELIQILYDAGASVNQQDKRGQTPVQLAAKYGFTKAIKKLHEYRADLNGVSNNGWTPLVHAILGGKTDAIKTLLSLNVDVNQKVIFRSGEKWNGGSSNRWPPVHFACDRGYVSTLQLLMDMKADITQRNEKHQTALMICCVQENFKCAKVLIDAAPNMLKPIFKSYFSLPKAEQKNSVRKFLKKHVLIQEALVDRKKIPALKSLCEDDIKKLRDKEEQICIFDKKRERNHSIDASILVPISIKMSKTPFECLRLLVCGDSDVHSASKFITWFIREDGGCVFGHFLRTSCTKLDEIKGVSDGTITPSEVEPLWKHVKSLCRGQALAQNFEKSLQLLHKDQKFQNSYDDRKFTDIVE